MEITEVRIKLMEDPGERLQGFCSVTIDDCFVIRDLKIIEGTSGPFVAMPSRKLTAHCPQCGCKNHLRAAYCNQCGTRLKDDRTTKDEDGRAKLYADIAHPINSTCREMLQERVIQAFRDEQERAKQPGYVSSYDDFDEELPPARRYGERKESAPVTSKPRLPSHKPVERPAAERTVVQPAEPEPRGPHKAPAHAVSLSPSAASSASAASAVTPPATSAGPPKRSEFGAGIW